MVRAVQIFVLGLCLSQPVAAQVLGGAARVFDGDTIEVAGQTVRLFGVDAPEMEQTCEDAAGKGWACGRWAHEQLVARLAGQAVSCEIRDRDKYGRAVASCQVAGRDLGRELVRAGVVFAYARYSKAYLGDEADARAAGLGVWAGGAVVRPEAFRHSGGEPVAKVQGCVIKGNISGAERIYHLPGQRGYDDTRISPSQGERWFCSVEEAEAAGWRARR